MAEEKRERARWEELVVLLIVWLIRSFVLMLALGALHNDWTPQVPALGFWACLAVASVFSPGMMKRK